LPLVPVSDVAPERLPESLTAVAKRFRGEATPELKTLLTATSISTGLRYRREQVAGLIEGVANMILMHTKAIEESRVYQDLFAKGRAEGEAAGEAKGKAEEARKILLRRGRKRLGEPDARVQAEIEAIAEVERLEALLDRVLDASSWDELLPPAAS
jgi:predicted transposase YdaD